MERTWLVFRLGPCILCASALDVEGIIQPPGAITKFPLTPDYALGAFLFRGHTASAISLRRKLKLRQGEDSRTGPFIVARIRDSRVAFWVDEVRDVLEEKDADWRQMPDMLADGLFERFAIRGTELILQTSFAALLEAKVDFDTLATWVAAHADAGAAPTVAQPRIVPTEAKPEPCAPAVAIVPAIPAVATTAMPLPQPASPPTPEARRPAMARARYTLAVQGDGKRDLRIHLPRVSAAVTPAATPVRADASAVKVESPRQYGRAGARIATGTVVAIVAIAAAFYGLRSPSSTEPAAKPVVSIKPDASPAPASSAPLVLSTERVSAPAESPRVEPVAQQVAPIKPDAPNVERVHIVVRGDTLWHIAKRHAGDARQYRELARVSNIPNPDLIRPGDPVRIETRQPK